MLTMLAAIAPAFDIEAASRAYLDTLSGAARAKSDAYFEGGYWIILWDALVAVASYLVMLRFGWSARWRGWAERATRWKFVQALIYSVPFIIVGTLLALPWGIYTGFLRENQYGLMNQSFAGWLGEQGIMLGVGVVTTSLLIAVVFAVIRRWPGRWWIGATAAIVAMLLLFVMITPVFISPLLNKYTPMAAGPMRDGILTMAHAQGIPAENVYVFDASKQTKRVSANVSGLGPTIRISLNDNLLHRSTPEGIKSVMGHEMGHYVLDHIEWMIAQFAVLIAAMMFVLWWSVPRVIARFGGRWGVSGPGRPGRGAGLFPDRDADDAGCYADHEYAHSAARDPGRYLRARCGARARWICADGNATERISQDRAGADRRGIVLRPSVGV